MKGTLKAPQLSFVSLLDQDEKLESDSSSPNFLSLDLSETSMTLENLCTPFIYLSYGEAESCVKQVMEE